VSRVGELTDDVVHLWYVLSDAVTDPALLARYAALMAPDERARHDRFVFQKDRHQFLVTRGTIRTLIGRVLGVDPADCVFAADAYGRPALRHPPGAPLAFNISHTRGLVVCALARAREIGVDVEDLQRPVSHDLARRFFSASEADTLDCLPEPARTARFYDYWTLKEAYIKARGMGLSLPLDGFSMLVDGGGPPSIRFSAQIDDDPATWQFARFSPARRYCGAVAVRRRGADVAIQVREFQESEAV
jgi:4'-phosphopantetheinyl transferase